MKLKFKKRYIFTLLLGLVFAYGSLFYANTTSADEGSSAVTSPSMKSRKKYPGADDTYFTYYSTITGYKKDGYWGFYNASRTVNLPPIYTEIEGLNDKYIKVKANTGWGLISTSGNILIKPIYESLERETVNKNIDSFEVKLYGRSGVVDHKGAILVPLEYDEIHKVNMPNYAKVEKDGKIGIYGVVEKKLIIPVEYDSVAALPPHFKFRIGEKWGVINKNAKVLVPAEYDNIKILDTNYFEVKVGKLWGLVDGRISKEIIPPKYEKIEIYNTKYFKVRQNGKWGAVSVDGKVVVPTTKGPSEIKKAIDGLR